MTSHNDHLGNGTTTRPAQEQQWATDKSFGDAALEDPDITRPDGWKFEDAIPYDVLNWQWKMLGRWLTYLDSKLHGSFGHLEVEEDTSGVYAVTLVASGTGGTAAEATFEADTLRGDRIQPPERTNIPDGDLEIVDPTSGLARVKMGDIVLDSPDFPYESVQANSGRLVVLDSSGTTPLGGASTVIEVSEVVTDKVRAFTDDWDFYDDDTATDTQTPVVDAEDEVSGDRAAVNSLMTPIAQGIVQYDRGGTSASIVSKMVNLGNVTYVADTGEFEVTVTNLPGIENMTDVGVQLQLQQPAPSSVGAVPRTGKSTLDTNAGTLDLRIAFINDNGNPVDPGVTAELFIQVYGLAR
jgi:hypothetical protein